MRCIYAEKLWDDIAKRLVVKDRDPIIRTLGIAIRKIIEAQPTADAVEVVRCKDCKHWKEITNGNWEHEPYCEWAGWLIGGNGYCVYGEREEE